MTAKDPLRYFRVEAREISEELTRDAYSLEEGVPSERVARMMRLAHTLKGAASVVKQRAIAEGAHALEDALAPLRDPAITPAPAMIAAVRDRVAAIASAITLVDASPAPARRNVGVTLNDAFGALRTDPNELDVLLDTISEARARLRGVRQALPITERVRHVAELLSNVTRPAPGGRDTHDSGALQAWRLADDLQQMAATVGDTLRDGADQAERELRQAYVAAERMRLVPCRSAFTSLADAVGEAAAELGKQADLEVEGGDVRLEPQLLTLVQRALVQLLRNALAHGIETPGDRLAAGKPGAGRIVVHVSRRTGRITVTCTDDGAGIDLGAVRRSAEAGGRLSGEELSDAALLDLLLEGGISTTGTVTEAAGRGVGLDVVREAAARLGATLSARTEAGVGTSIELGFPVALSSLEALLAEAGGAQIAVPLYAIRSVARLAPSAGAHGGAGDTVVVNGASLKLAHLAHILGARPSPDAPRSAIVLNDGTAIAVDRLRGLADVVVRPPPALAHADPIVGGVFLDAEGAPHPVLDPEALAGRIAAPAGPWEPEQFDPLPPILVVDDSLTTRMLEQSILESAGYEVDLAASAEEALELARQRHYGLFLVDVEMPGMDGFGFVDATRADVDLRSVPAILVTSRAAAEDRQRGIAAGASAYVVKSEFDQVQVLDTIRSLLGRR